jgi:hypothetical protein
VKAPGYWMNETSGVLRPAVEAYLNRDEMTPSEIAALRAYIRQWIAGDFYPTPTLETLRRSVDGLTDRQAIARWLAKALAEGIDPL